MTIVIKIIDNYTDDIIAFFKYIILNNILFIIIKLCTAETYTMRLHCGFNVSRMLRGACCHSMGRV